MNLQDFEQKFVKIIDEVSTLSERQFGQYQREMTAYGLPESLVLAIKEYKGANGPERIRNDFKKLTNLLDSIERNGGSVKHLISWRKVVYLHE